MSTLTKSIVIPAVIGSCLYCSNALFTHIFSTYISPRMYSCVTIYDSDIEYFEAVLEFIETEKNILANHLVLCKGLHSPSGDGVKLRSIYYQPANTGELLSVNHEGKTIYVKRVKETSETRKEGDHRIIPMEKLLISVLGPEPLAIKSLIASAIQHKNSNISKNTCVFMCDDHWMDRWDKITEGPPRTMESVILKQTSHDVLQDMRMFLVSSDWYNRMGIPYRRGYLLYGPPGNGKTSLCTAFAGELRQDICILSLSSPILTDGKLSSILRKAPSRSLIVLEDVDAAFEKRKKVDSASSKLTFSGLLNAIDGVVSQEGHIFIMTTNHIEKLDPALVRPGRCDVKLEVCNASRDQLEAMFVRFFPGREADARLYASRIPENEISMAQVQNHLVANKNSSENAIETAALLKAETLFKQTPRRHTTSISVPPPP